MPERRAVPTLDVVIVAWGHDATMAGCLRALDVTSREGFVLERVVLVDNDPHRPTCGFPGTSFTLDVIRNRANVGSAPACNQGAHGSTADYLLFLNPDACVGSESLARAGSRKKPSGSTSMLRTTGMGPGLPSDSAPRTGAGDVRAAASGALSAEDRREGRRRDCSR